MPANISRNCSIGKHNRCLGTVVVFPPVDGQRIAKCECSAPDCPHVLRGAAAAETPEDQCSDASEKD